PGDGEDLAHVPHPPRERAGSGAGPVRLPGAEPREPRRSHGGARLSARRYRREPEHLGPGDVAEEAHRPDGTALDGPLQVVHAGHPQILRLPAPRPPLPRPAGNPREIPRAAAGHVLPPPLVAGPPLHRISPGRTADRFGFEWVGPDGVREAQRGVPR